MIVAAAGVALAVGLGLAFAGSPQRLADGVRVAGVDVGGMTAGEAEALLERRAAELATAPVTFVAGTTSTRLTPAQLGIEADWDAAVAAALGEGDGVAPVRGFRRLRARFFGAEITPPVHVSEAALGYAVARIARSVDRSAREAAIVLRGLRPVLAGERAGRSLDRPAAEASIVRALAGLSRRAPVPLPVRVESPQVTARELRRELARVRVAVSAPVRLALGPTRWRVPRWRIAQLLDLPNHGQRAVSIGGAEAQEFFARFGRSVERPATDADFVAHAGGTVTVRPAAPGRELDEAATARSLLAAATSRRRRVARVVIRSERPSLTTAEARALGVTRVLSSFSTAYAGTADRTHNLQLAVSLLDGTIVRPGEVFSLNARVGERTAERGFRSAPVIVGGEYKEGVGGGVSQVATTIFNAAWEAGLKIVERNPHSLYISRYPLGRDATVNYPNLDLKFLNDTGRPLVVRGVSTASGITISLYGAPTGRRVVSEAGPLVVTGPAPLQTVRDSSLLAGTTVVEEGGSPSTAVTVKRTVFGARGRVLYRESWRTEYRGELRVVRIGTKPPPKPEPRTETEPQRPERSGTVETPQREKPKRGTVTTPQP